MSLKFSINEKMQYDKIQQKRQIEKVKENYCTGVKIMILFWWVFISITYIEINTINATNIYVVDVCTKRKFYRKKRLIELIEKQLRKKLN